MERSYLYIGYVGSANFEDGVLPMIDFSEEKIIKQKTFGKIDYYEIEHYYMVSTMCSTSTFSSRDIGKIYELKYGKMLVGDDCEYVKSWISSEFSKIIENLESEMEIKLRFYNSALEEAKRIFNEKFVQE